MFVSIGVLYHLDNSKLRYFTGAPGGLAPEMSLFIVLFFFFIYIKMKNKSIVFSNITVFWLINLAVFNFQKKPTKTE